MYKLLADRIDAAIEQDAETSFRAHLGGSLIGRECERQLWYSFRWSKQSKHGARMLRLFARGQREEAQFVALLRKIDVEVREFSERLVYHPSHGQYALVPWDETGPVDPELENVSDSEEHMILAAKQGVKPKQWRILDVDGHFGGSLDGIGRNFPDLAGDGLLEFKTHNTKSFVHLVANGVRIAKPEHWAQMQIYMHKRELQFAIYGAVNKNDNDLWWEYVEYDPKIGPKLLEKAKRIIHAKKPPERISNSPAWHACKYCDYNRICHFAEPLLKNCRTCQNSVPASDGQWFCSHWKNTIPVDFMTKGCDEYKPITD